MSGTGESPLGISILIKSPAVLGTPSITERLVFDSVNSYSHKISAVGGYESAEINILVSNMSMAEVWFSEALGWHIEVFGRSGLTMWEGFINSITINGSQFTAIHGPLMDISNRVSVMYTPILDPTEDPPIVGTLTETTINDDTESQGLYGILERVLSGGQLLDDGTDNDAEYIRDVYLSENAYPKSDTDISLGGGEASGGISITLGCRGYIDWLDKYVYNDGTYNYSITASTKIQNVLGADPNSLLSTNYNLIESNAVLTAGLEDKNRTALTIIKEILSLGDGTDTPFSFGVYENRVVKYESIPNDIEYYYKIFSQKNTFASEDGSLIDPYDILPGKWALIADFQVGKRSFTVFDDPRALFVESVDFTAPNSVNISGSPVVRLPQMLARLGYGGIS